MDQLKIGLATWDLGISGGTQRLMLELARNLKAMGAELKVYSVFFDMAKSYGHLLDGLDITCLFEGEKAEALNYKDTSIIREKINYITNIIRYKNYASKLVDLMEEIDVLNIHDHPIYFVSPVFKKRFNKPVVWTLNDPPKTRTQTAGAKIPLYKRLYKKLFGSDFIARKWEKIIFEGFHSADKIVVLDNLNKEKLREHFQVDSIILRGGLNLEDYKFIPRKVSKGTIRIFCNGIFFPYRRYEDVIEALSILESKNIGFTLDHVGTPELDPVYASKIYDMVKALGMSEDIIFHGFVSESDLIDFYSGADIFIFPNSPQTWGLAVFEAMACGTPVIVSKGAGASEVLTNGENAILIDPCKPEQIAAGIMLLKEDEELWNKLHINGRKFVEEYIRWDMYAEKMYGILKDAVYTRA